MLNGIIEWSPHNQLLVVGGATLALVWGTYVALQRMCRLFPEKCRN